MRERPSPCVLRAFGAEHAALRRVTGGQGATFRAGDIAIKRCDEPEESEWLGRILTEIKEDGFRVARPMRSPNGRFVVDGWCAHRWVSGSPRLRGRWGEAVAALRAFHRALREVRRPRLFDRRTNMFAVADRIAWDEEPLKRAGNLGTDGARLLRCLRPVRARSQLIQGDPSEGNFLFDGDLPPAVIDVAPYWRPADYSVAVFVADGVAWSKAPRELLACVRRVPEIDQLLARAVLFRLIVGKLFRRGDAVPRRSAAYAPVIDAVVEWSGR